jgi:hypothetical protein
MAQSPHCDGSCPKVGDCREYGTIESFGVDFIMANETLDYALVKLRKKPCVVSGKYGCLSFRRAPPVAGELMYMPIEVPR